MKSLLLGLDAFSPEIAETLFENGRLPHLGKYISSQRYARFGVTNPPQSEVSWTSIATGLNPGGHGMFDFVHRNPANYNLIVSLLPTQQNLLGTQFVPPFTARTLFDQAVADGYPATALWWPAMFPARPQSPVTTLPGLGTPDIHGRLGVGILFTDDGSLPDPLGKTRVCRLDRLGSGRYRGAFPGPARKKGKTAAESTLDLQLEITEPETIRCRLGKQSLTLTTGQWSPILTLSFKTGRFFSVKVITRLIVTQTAPTLQLYSLPLQIHPLNSPWHYAAPRRFAKKMWQAHGPFLTLGWPQDTVGLEDGCINDEQFLALCTDIVATREAILMDQIDHFSEGVLATVFDSLDRIQHMFWQERPDIVESWYEKLDALVGRVEQKVLARQPDTRLIVVSDHGFTSFDHKVHLNRWLADRDYLNTGGVDQSTTLAGVDWSKSQAYALGLNSLYLNLAGREGQGIVAAGEVEPLRRRLRQELLAWQGPDNRPIIQDLWFREDAFDGPLVDYSPDLVVGYAPGYRASAQTGLGGWEKTAVTPNHDHWNGDHCISAAAVPGVIMANNGLTDFPNPTYKDMPALALGKEVDPGQAAPPPVMSDEEQAIVEKRLQDLGYL